MFTYDKTFSSFSVNDLAKAKDFYQKTLGLDVQQTAEGLSIKVSADNTVFIYPKPNHTPASFTILNFQVHDIERQVGDLTAAGVKFLQYEGEIKTDPNGIHRGDGKGPDIAWFTDPAGNILSVLQSSGL